MIFGTQLELAATFETGSIIGAIRIKPACPTLWDQGCASVFNAELGARRSRDQSARLPTWACVADVEVLAATLSKFSAVFLRLAASCLIIGDLFVKLADAALIAECILAHEVIVAEGTAARKDVVASLRRCLCVHVVEAKWSTVARSESKDGDGRDADSHG